MGGAKLVMMLGALHIEEKIYQMTGKLLRDSGGTTVLSQAQVLTCMVSCDGPHKLWKMVVSSCAGYVSAV